MKAIAIFLQFLSCLILLQVTTACDKEKSKRQSVRVARGIPGSTGEYGADSGYNKTGVSGAIVGDTNGASGNQRVFNQNVKAFAQAFMADPFGQDNPELALGEINSSYQQISQSGGTGIRFEGQFRIGGNQNFDPNRTYNDQISEVQSLKVYIKGSKVVSDTGNNFSAIDIPGNSGRIQLVRGTISGKRVNLTFRYQPTSVPNDIYEGDDRQTAREKLSYSLEFEGSYERDSNWLVGNVYYENYFYNRGLLGGFYIPTRDFFR